MPYGRRSSSLEFPASRFPAWLCCFAVISLLWLNIGASFGATHEPARPSSARVSRQVVPSSKSVPNAKIRSSNKAKKPTGGKAPRRVAHKRKQLKGAELPMHASQHATQHRKQAARSARNTHELRGVRRSVAAAHASPRSPRLLARCGYTPKSRGLLRAKAVYVVDERTHTVLTEKQADRVMPIASVSKLMTAVVSLDARHALNAPLDVTVQDQDFDKFTGSRLSVGSRLSRHDMLHIALMSSENRAAAALSRDYAGGRPGFVAAMNAKARALGMRHTSFVNGTGLSPHNVSTARDLSLLVAAASRYPLIRAYSTDRAQVVLPGGGRARLSYVNSNALVRGGDRSIVLQKTGFINEAGHCVVVRIRVRGRPVDIVVLGAPGARDHIADVERISRWLHCSLR